MGCADATGDKGEDSGADPGGGDYTTAFVYDNNYFNDTYQGIPIGGYTQIVEKMLAEAEVRLNTDFLENYNGHMEMNRIIR